MNNTLCLGIFAALVYFRDLSWQFSAGTLVHGPPSNFTLTYMPIHVGNYLILAEVTVIILVEVAVGLMAVLSGFGYKHTYVVSRSAAMLTLCLCVTSFSFH